VAVLRAGPTESLIQGLHQSLFRAEKRIGLMLFGKGNIGSRWLELFAREQTRSRRVPVSSLFSPA
jgi:aspartokinase/homoserine dehydrogenase 2